MTARWGAPEDDPFVSGDRFCLPLARFGKSLVGIQPARGYNIDPKATYHDPDLVPPHGYLAFYAWLREVFGAHAVVHMGKHGNLEWLPGQGAGAVGGVLSGGGASGRCRSSIRSSSTIPAKARRPSGAPRRSSSTT